MPCLGLDNSFNFCPWNFALYHFIFVISLKVVLLFSYFFYSDQKRIRVRVDFLNNVIFCRLKRKKTSLQLFILFFLDIRVLPPEFRASLVGEYYSSAGQLQICG